MDLYWELICTSAMSEWLESLVDSFFNYLDSRDLLGFFAHGCVFLILCVLQRLFRSESCLMLLALYGLLFMILIWSKDGFWTALPCFIFMIVCAGLICRDEPATTRRGNPVYCGKCNSRDLEIISEDDNHIAYKCRKCGYIGAKGLLR